MLLSRVCSYEQALFCYAAIAEIPSYVAALD